jgi:putative transposase
MEQKLRFLFEYDQGERTMTELCQQHGISRETGYVWLRRYRAYGLAGLAEHSRAPQRHPNQTPGPIVRMVLELRQAHMRWDEVPSPADLSHQLLGLPTPGAAGNVESHR